MKKNRQFGKVPHWQHAFCDQYSPLITLKINARSPKVSQLMASYGVMFSYMKWIAQMLLFEWSNLVKKNLSEVAEFAEMTMVDKSVTLWEKYIWLVLCNHSCKNCPICWIWLSNTGKFRQPLSIHISFWAYN